MTVSTATSPTPVSPATTPADTATNNPLGIRGFHHIEFWVDDATAWRDRFCLCYGLRPRAYGHPGTGLTDRISYVVGQGRVNYVVTQATGHGPLAREIADHVARHGNAVRDVAFRVRDAQAAYDLAIRRGAKSHAVLQSQNGWSAATIAAYGDTVHSFVQRRPDAPFAPGYLDIPGGIDDGEITFALIDHVVANVEKMEPWVAYYRDVFGFEQTGYFDIRTKRSALMSKVVGDLDGYIRLPINEPSSANSQIQEYLNANNGPGVQHVALLTTDIIGTVAEMKRQGVAFMAAPETYFDEPFFSQRVGEIRERVDNLRPLNILVDRDRPDGYLLQIFTDNVFERPTFFHEIIQRRGNSIGFGEGNFTALFEAIEREQIKRGTL